MRIVRRKAAIKLIVFPPTSSEKPKGVAIGPPMAGLVGPPTGHVRLLQALQVMMV